MVQSCQVVDCRRKWVAGSGVGFYQIPKKATVAVKQAWIDFAGEPFKPEPADYRLCSLHFAPNCFHYLQNGQRRINVDAIPTIRTKDIPTDIAPDARNDSADIGDRIATENWRMMVQRCRVVDCQRKWVSGSGVGFFKIPSTATDVVKQAWIDFAGEPFKPEPADYRLCSLHFAPNCFHYLQNGQRRINVDAIPTIRTKEFRNDYGSESYNNVKRQRRC